MRIDEITNSTEKLELLRMIDAAIWQAMDAESFYADNETEAEQGVAATPAANQFAPKSAAIQKPTTPVKKLTPQQQAHVKTLDHKQLLNYIKTNLKAPLPAPVPTKAARKPVANINPTPNNNNQSNSSFDTVNAKDNAAKYKNGESDRLA